MKHSMAIRSSVETASFGYKLAYHSAPSLLGLKPANLFSLNQRAYNFDTEVRRFRRNMGHYGLRMRTICRNQNRCTLLVFREDMLKRLLQDPDRRVVLTAYGYEASWDLEACLTFLSGRISHSVEFPHETGIFLGYPVQDVIGFIQNRGENFKLCGVWKVYDNPEQAQHTFDLYDRCREALCKQLEGDGDLYQTLPRLIARGNILGTLKKYVMEM